MNINEIFLSIQGESTYIGLPCIFIRFCGCNLNCSYCDTQYHTEIHETLTPQELLDRIQEYNPVKLVELTGGEPLLQQELGEVISLLHNQQYKVLIETNGSISLKSLPDYIHKIIDVKCPDSGEGNSFLKDNLIYFKPERDNLKFVISSENDYIWAKTFLKDNHLTGESIIFSTVLNKLEPRTIAESIIRDRLDVRFQLQIHKYIWSPEQKGV